MPDKPFEWFQRYANHLLQFPDVLSVQYSKATPGKLSSLVITVVFTSAPALEHLKTNIRRLFGTMDQVQLVVERFQEFEF